MLKPFTHAFGPFFGGSHPKAVVSGFFCLSTQKQIGNKAETRLKTWLNRTSPEGCLPSSLVMQFAFMLTNSHYNRQGALADGLHGLNPRITAHRYTPVKKATSVDLATGKAIGTTVEQGQSYKRTNPSCALGAFLFIKTLKAWRGKEEMASIHPWRTVEERKV